MGTFQLLEVRKDLSEMPSWLGEEVLSSPKRLQFNKSTQNRLKLHAEKRFKLFLQHLQLVAVSWKGSS